MDFLDVSLIVKLLKKNCPNGQKEENKNERTNYKN